MIRQCGISPLLPSRQSDSVVKALLRRSSRTMPELSVVIVAPDSEQRAVLQVLVDGTSVAARGA